MKPLNIKERRQAFWKFTLLFFLAVIPVCTAVYLYGRVDKAENNFLRSAYETKKDEGHLTAEYTEAREALIREASKISDYFGTDENISSFSTTYVRTVKLQADDLNKAKEDFKKEVDKLGLALEPDVQALLEITRSYELTLKSFGSIYGLGSEEIKEMSRELKDAKDDLREIVGDS